MTVYHVVLFKLKPGVNKAQIDTFAATAKTMVGKIPGLLDLQAGPGLPVSAPRAKGYDVGLVATLEKVDDVGPYGAHPAHSETLRLRDELCDDTLAFDFEF
ncbi:stress responsive A/B barrel domain protein [Usnea florida]